MAYLTDADTAAMIRLHQAIEAHTTANPAAPVQFLLSGPVSYMLGEWYDAYVVSIVIDRRVIIASIGETIAEAVHDALAEWKRASR